jgi:hypothetical protein
MAQRAKDERQAVKAHPARPRARAAAPRRPRESQGAAAALLQLQRTAGNGAVQRTLIQAKRDDGHGPAPVEVEEAIQHARGSGRPLDTPVQREMEEAFGTDFSAVRIHTDTGADRLSRSMSAQAFTTGRDLFFREGSYDPGSTAGRSLLAHELTHVVQQSGDEVRRKLVIGPADDQYEQEADRVAAEVVGRGAGGGAEPAIQRMCTGCEEDAQRQMEEEEEPPA